jgi:hypothetical protein
MSIDDLIHIRKKVLNWNLLTYEEKKEYHEAAKTIREHSSKVRDYFELYEDHNDKSEFWAKTLFTAGGYLIWEGLKTHYYHGFYESDHSRIENIKHDLMKKYNCDSIDMDSFYKGQDEL